MVITAPDFTQALLRVNQIHPDVARTRLLMQQFLQLLRERHGHELDQWLAAAFHSGVPEWRAFVRKLRQDHAAVQAGLTLNLTSFLPGQGEVALPPNPVNGMVLHATCSERR